MIMTYACRLHVGEWPENENGKALPPLRVRASSSPISVASTNQFFASDGSVPGLCLATGCSAMTTSELCSPHSLSLSCGDVGKIFFDFSDASIQSAIVVPFCMICMAVWFRTRHPVVSLIHDARVVGI